MAKHKTRLELAIEEGERLAKIDSDQPRRLSEAERLNQFPPIYEYGEQAPMPTQKQVGAAMDTAGEFGRGLAEIPTFGASTAIERNVRGIADYAMSDDPNLTLSQAIDNVGDILTESMDENFGARTAGNIVAGIGTGVGAAKLISKAPKIAEKIGGSFLKRSGIASAVGTAENVGIEAGRGNIEDRGDLVT